MTSWNPKTAHQMRSQAFMYWFRARGLRSSKEVPKPWPGKVPKSASESAGPKRGAEESAEKSAPGSAPMLTLPQKGGGKRG